MKRSCFVALSVIALVIARILRPRPPLPPPIPCNADLDADTKSRVLTLFFRAMLHLDDA